MLLFTLHDASCHYDTLVPGALVMDSSQLLSSQHPLCITLCTAFLFPVLVPGVEQGGVHFASVRPLQIRAQGPNDAPRVCYHVRSNRQHLGGL